MNRSFLRGASLCLALITSLLVASCSSPAPREMPDGLTSQNCLGCVHFDVIIGFYTPTHTGSLREVLEHIPGFPSPSDEGSAENRVISSRNSGDIPSILRKHGTFASISRSEAMTKTGKPFSVSLRGPSGDFDAVFTPRTSLNNRPGVVSYEVRAEPASGTFEPTVKALNTGSVVLNSGDSLLIIQKANGGYVVWLVRAAYPR